MQYGIWTARNSLKQKKLKYVVEQLIHVKLWWMCVKYVFIELKREIELISFGAFGIELLLMWNICVKD